MKRRPLPLREELRRKGMSKIFHVPEDEDHFPSVMTVAVNEDGGLTINERYVDREGFTRSDFLQLSMCAKTLEALKYAVELMEAELVK